MSFCDFPLRALVPPKEENEDGRGSIWSGTVFSDRMLVGEKRIDIFLVTLEDGIVSKNCESTER